MYQRYIKRILDITAATVLLVLALPLSIITSIAIRIESSGPTLFRQTRSGINGEPFTLNKFRSMAAKNNVYDTSKKNEITKVGAFIRRFSIDEIPQLMNVLLGDMSLVGPRPWIPEYYKNMDEKQRQRYKVRPGITGLAQARGRNALTIHDKIDSDIEYVQEITFTKDLKIILFTLRTMLDKSTVDISKKGIDDEIEALKKQSASTILQEVT